MNPKDSIGLTKAPLSYLPPAALVPVAMVMRNGAEKYGRTNWREHSLLRTVYLEAALRHVFADLDGEEIDPESGLPHVAHAVAGLLILMDAQAIGKCKDDRPTSGGFSDVCRRVFQPKREAHLNGKCCMSFGCSDPAFCMVIGDCCLFQYVPAARTASVQSNEDLRIILMLSGYKTYIICAVTVLYAGVSFFFGAMDMNTAAALVLGASGLGAIRDAIEKK